MATMLARLERSEKRRRPSDAGADASGGGPEREVPRRPGRARHGALGRQPEHPLGVVHAGDRAIRLSRRLAGDARRG